MRILSGIQPTGRPHVGNYLGMLRPAVALQERGEAFLFLADYHALTTVRDGAALRVMTREAAIDVLACGFDPERSVLFRQSDVPEVTELAWILANLTPVGLLERCHSYKDKVARGLPANHGLFSYPVLMAADILAYRSTVVPVGRDQKQHVEVTRDIATRFNNAYGDLFTVPEPSILDAVATVPGIDGRKMSKSYGNQIDLFGGWKAMRRRVMAIVTDSTPLEAPKNPDTCTVFALYRLFAPPADIEAMAGRYRSGGYGYGEAKQALFEAMRHRLEPLHERRETLAADPHRVEEVLRAGAAIARREARATLAGIRRAVGFD